MKDILKPWIGGEHVKNGSQYAEKKFEYIKLPTWEKFRFTKNNADIIQHTPTYKKKSKNIFRINQIIN